MLCRSSDLTRGSPLGPYTKPFQKEKKNDYYDSHFPEDESELTGVNNLAPDLTFSSEEARRNSLFQKYFWNAGNVLALGSVFCT